MTKTEAQKDAIRRTGRYIVTLDGEELYRGDDGVAALQARATALRKGGRLRWSHDSFVTEKKAMSRNTTDDAPAPAPECGHMPLKGFKGYPTCGKLSCAKRYWRKLEALRKKEDKR